MKIEYSILDTDKRVKIDKIVFLERFDGARYKQTTIQKPESTILSTKYLGNIQQATLASTEKTLEEWEKQWKKIGKRVNETLTAQDRILKVLDSLISNEFKEESNGKE